ncbi:MAG: purine nucleoside permease [Cellvibrionaceae bacterium]|nr:purine nucleoside permease [Cellvibrionaceae bacterium]
MIKPIQAAGRFTLPRGARAAARYCCNKYRKRWLWLAALLTAVLCSASSNAAEKALPIKAVVVTMFENGEITGDRPGEFQYWVERSQLHREMAFPLGEYPLRLSDSGVLGICVGGGIANATASIMALGLDPRFDLSKAYWLVAGIAGGDPEDISLGSAAWARYVVDGDLTYEIDAREIPAEWPYGLIPLGANKPAEKPADIYTSWTLNTVAFDLNPQLAQWAYELTRDMQLQDTPAMAQFRAQFKHYPKARLKPFVALGDTLSASTYWHGRYLNRWANDWMRLYSDNQANFMTTNMEDSGTLTALLRLGRLALVNTQRIMVLRTVSNYSMPPQDKPANWSVTAPYPDEGKPALDTAWRVGSKVIDTLVKHWPRYADTEPAAAKAKP